MLRGSACLNTGFVQMWALHAGFLIPDLGAAIPEPFNNTGVPSANLWGYVGIDEHEKVDRVYGQVRPLSKL